MSCSPTQGYWRIQAASIVSELFPVTSPDFWDDLLDLRSLLLHPNRLHDFLDQFLRCRHRLEADHYLPFYRLRRLIESSLRLSARFSLEKMETLPLRPIFWKNFRSVNDIRKGLGRHRFEHDLAFSAGDPVHLEVKEMSVLV